MSDCMYIVTQDDLDELESCLEVYKATMDLRDAIKEAVDALSAAFAQVVVSVEEILKGLSDLYLGITWDAPEIYKPRPKPKRPQRNLFLRYEPMLDKRSQIQQRRRNKCP